MFYIWLSVFLQKRISGNFCSVTLSYMNKLQIMMFFLDPDRTTVLVFKYRVARWVCSELGTLSYEPVFEVSKEPVEKRAKFEITFKVWPIYYFLF